MPDGTFVRPDLTTFARLDELGLEVTGQRLERQQWIGTSGAGGADAKASLGTLWCGG